MIEQYTKAFQSALHHLLRDPSSSFEYGCTLFASGILFIFVLHKSVDSMGSRGMSFKAAILPSIVGMALAIAGGTVTQIYLEGSLGPTGLLVLGMFLASSLVVVPVLNAELRCGYMNLFGSWLFATVSFVLMVIMVNGVFGFIETSEKFGNDQQERNAKMQELFK